ncbi:MAG: FkbM family methyltransferase [Planctomycetaceae bacterium]|nr:FkbM family methyltransferase [Planctomycetaceae bacterium]
MASQQTHEARLLTFRERAKFALTPKRLYAHYRAARELRHRACEPELRLLPYLVDRSRCSIDVGANRGSYTYFLSRLSQHVFAYEPNPAMRRYLRGAVNNNVTVSEKALTDHAGEATLSIPFNGKRCANNTGSLEPGGAADQDCVSITVPTARLDDEPVRTTGFIKIDVEGHERSVLRGAAGLIARDRPVLLVEILPQPGARHLEETIEQIEAMGYESFVMVDSQLIMLSSLVAGRIKADADEVARRASNNFIFLPAGRKAA